MPLADTQQVRDVFENNCSRALRLRNTYDFVEKLSAWLLEATLRTGAAEGLARKSRCEYFVRRHIARVDCGDVAAGELLPKVRGVRLPRVRADFARKDGRAAERFERDAEAANTGEELNEAETRRSGRYRCSGRASARHSRRHDATVAPVGNPLDCGIAREQGDDVVGVLPQRRSRCFAVAAAFGCSRDEAHVEPACCVHRIDCIQTQVVVVVVVVGFIADDLRHAVEVARASRGEEDCAAARCVALHFHGRLAPAMRVEHVEYSLQLLQRNGECADPHACSGTERCSIVHTDHTGS